MQEQEFFNQNDVRVTNTRFMVNGQTYAMNGVTSVKRGLKTPARGAPIFLILVGGAIIFASKPFGLLVLGLAFLWLFMQNDEHTVMLSSASGESQALTSTDKEYIQSIIDALNEAIIHRG